MKIRLLCKIGLILAMATLLAACPSAENAYTGGSQPSWHISDFIPFAPPSSLWQAMSPKFQLEGRKPHQSVQHELRFFTRHQAYIKELTHNAQPYLYYVYRQTRKKKMPAEIALMPMIESNYNPFEYSNRGATGLWQMMPGTASGFGIKINWWYDGRRDIIASTAAALDYLQYLHGQFGNWLLAIAAYDAGEGTIRAAIRRNQRLHKPTDFWSLRLPLETKTYVPKILALARIIKHPTKYHLRLQPVPNESFFDKVNMTGQVDLNRVARLARTKVSNIRLLNPGFRRWATSPENTYALLIPKSRIDDFNASLQAQKHHHVTWYHHTVVAGDSLSRLAENYNTSVSVLERVNNLKSNTIRVGENLLIPQAMHNTKQLMAANNKYYDQTHSSIAEDRIPGPQRVTHTVAKNDNLWTIAKRYHVTPDQIRYWNKLAYRGNLHVNQELVLWLPHHHYRTAQPKTMQYHVQSGDSLFKIAMRFNISMEQIKAINHLTSDNLQIGKTLRIPVKTASKAPKQLHFLAMDEANGNLILHTVEKGESLSEIAKEYHVSSDNIAKWNHLTAKGQIRYGQQLRIYAR